MMSNSCQVSSQNISASNSISSTINAWVLSFATKLDEECHAEKGVRSSSKSTVSNASNVFRLVTGSLMLPLGIKNFENNIDILTDGRFVSRKTRKISKDIEKFRKLKSLLRTSGVTTNFAIQEIIPSIIVNGKAKKRLHKKEDSEKSLLSQNGSLSVEKGQYGLTWNTQSNNLTSKKKRVISDSETSKFVDVNLKSLSSTFEESVIKVETSSSIQVSEKISFSVAA